MKIIGLKIEGLRKLKAVELKFKESGLIPIRGKNKQGKTSVIDAFELLLRGKKKLTQDMINRDSKKIKLIGEIQGRDRTYTITRSYTDKSDTLKIKDNLGHEIAKNPQTAFLDELANELTFNPQPFRDKTATEKWKFVMDLFNVDLTEIDEKITQKEADRKELSKSLKNLGEAKPASQCDFVDVEGLSKELKSTQAENNRRREQYTMVKDEKIKRLHEYNSEQDKKQNKINESKRLINDLNDKRGDLTKQIAELETRRDQIDVRLRKGNAHLKSLASPGKSKSMDSINMPELDLIDESEIQGKIESAVSVNIKAQQYKDYLEKQEKKSKTSREVKKLNDIINNLRLSKKEKLQSIQHGIKGLEIRENGLYFNGYHCDNWSGSEETTIGVKLFKHKKPKLNAIFIDNGEKYDSGSYKALQEFAEENDIQCIIAIVSEVPDDKEPGVFYIEEGELL